MCLQALGGASCTGQGFGHGARLHARGLSTGTWSCFRQEACLQEQGAASGTGNIFRHGARLQPWGLSSGPGSTFRYSERLHAQGTTSGMRSLCALQAQGETSGTGLAIRHVAPSGKGCTARHGSSLQGVPVPLSQGERLQAWGLPSSTGSFIRHGVCLQAQGAPVQFGQGEHMCLSPRDAPSCTGNSRRHRECPQAGVQLESAHAIQAMGVPTGTGSAFRHGEGLQAW